MELRRHIEILLLSNDCVIVPQLGGFMAHHVDARYDRSDGMFIPPTRTLGFNPQLSMNDHLLVQSYADAYDLSYPEAMARVEHEVRQLKEHIEENGSYELTDLGTLSLTADGRYTFEPCASGVLTPSLYGFGAIDIPLLSEVLTAAHRTPSITLPTQPMGIIHPAAAPRTTKLATIMSHLDNPQQEEKTISIKVSLLHNLAVTAVAAVALLLFARPLPASDSGAMEESSEEASIAAVASTNSEEATPATASIVGGLEVVAQKLKNFTEEGVVPKEGDYTVVLACSLPLDNAKAFLADVKSKGAHKAVLMTYKEKNVVAYGSYSNSDEAYAQLQALISNGSVASGWVMHVK